MHRNSTSLNELLLCGCYNGSETIDIFSTYSDPGPLAVSVIDIPHFSGLGLVFRTVDFLLMDLSKPLEPYCLCKISCDFLRSAVESVDESSRGLGVDDEGISARALLALKDSLGCMDKNYDPISFDDRIDDSKSRSVCSCDWDPTGSNKLMVCLSTGDLCMLDIFHEPGGIKVNVFPSHLVRLRYKFIRWVKGGIIAAFAEMGDGVVLKLENEKWCAKSTIQNTSPILDMSFIDYHEKQDQLFACCGISPEGSLRTIRSGINIDKLVQTQPIYQGITGTWALRMKENDFFDSFLVLSFVEETRVLSVGLNFVDVSDAVGFQPNVCTLACGLLSDGLLVQIHSTEVRVCFPTSSAHPEGITRSEPICISWNPINISICRAAVGQNLIVIATSNPCFLSVLATRSSSSFHHEVYEIQRVELPSEVSCISIPKRSHKHEHMTFFADQCHANVFPAGVDIGRTFLIGTHKPSVEILTLVPDECIKTIAIGNTTRNNALGTFVTGCIPEDVRFVLVDRCYVLSGLRNGMLLRFEWPARISPSFSGSEAPICMPVPLQMIAFRRIGITPVFLVPLHDSLDSEIIALSDRPWLLHSGRHGIAYTSISFEPSTHVTPVKSIDCPKGILFVAESSLHLVEMVQSKRLNVHKFPIGGTPRKILYHKESKTLLVMRIGLHGSTCSSDVCRIDPLSGSLLAKLKFHPGETARCMQIMKVGNEQVLVVGTSETGRLAIMPNGEAESSLGRVIVISLDNNNSLEFCSNLSVSSQVSPSLHEILGYATEQLSSSSHCSSPDDIVYEGVKSEIETGDLKFITSKSFPGVVMSISPYLDHYFLISAGNMLCVFGFLNNNPRRLRRFASTRTRFAITGLSTYLTRIQVSDCRDGVLFFSYHEDKNKLEQFKVDPVQRLIADCLLLDMNTAAVSDKRGNISILSSISEVEDSASPECNLTQCCTYYIGETVSSMRKMQGSCFYKPSRNDGFMGYADSVLTPDPLIGSIVATTLLGSVMIFMPIRSEVYDILSYVESKLACHHLTAPILGNNHKVFRQRGTLGDVPTMLDGDMLSQFLELTNTQQESVLACPCPLDDTNGSSSSCLKHISVSQVVQLLEQIHYTLN